ncbi:uncharacterized protein CANTADRAFT_26089 [Suhomyces tanzawaensis NRRL Y-17324]|uniref:BSD domain-containing protein n=1 Tax=Suhomyces tanzawaensis NRRL Y-17324 TaxID=984487 RepID=A0A1E4SHM1_9ASCO|nr:uncharacterized protein CANTADRAFT_26089 [Suhomyces tanzawaensis NRRL Y-17324]ODV79008.1 hypothetical protein CANTADRAFT_26089 [Suhomyces tanzawaensis NRRL Y-17324]
MDSVSGACSVDKLSGMVSIREDVTPLIVEWKAIDRLKTISIPLNSLNNLQATKEGSPKMILKIVYKIGNQEEKSIRLTFNNRPTMNNIKDSLQTIVARQRTIIKDLPGPPSSAGTPGASGSPGTPTAPSTPGTPAPPQASTLGSSSMSSDSLSDANLLKNLQLQQKLLLEDRNLRNIFTQSVMNFKLSPTIFWSSRLNQLRTYALTISQHRGPYNVLSTIKPVATSDNQVNVNVTRETINEIFDTYPIIKKAFKDLVPVKISEGEFWSRFFNSKLFRRLRGDKINTSNDRGDVVLDKYLYIDQDFNEDDGTSEPVRKKPDIRVNKFIDILGNEDDNSSKLGNRPDMTMRFSEDGEKLSQSQGSGGSPQLQRRGSTVIAGQENEMIILMKNMNKLSSKMVNMSQDIQNQPEEHSGVSQYDFTDELNLHDLNEIEDPHFIRLNIDPDLENKKIGPQATGESPGGTPAIASKLDPQTLKDFILSNQFAESASGLDLTDTYKSKNDEIEKTSNEILQLVKQNFRTHKLITKEYTAGESVAKNLIPESLIQEIITYNMTIVEFLSHFWKLFLGGNNPNQLKKIFVSLKNCQNDLNALKERSIKSFGEIELVKTNDKLKDKIIKDFHNCISPMEIGLEKACEEYVKAVKKEQEKEKELNENGKRALEV